MDGVNSIGCDSIATLNLVINTSSSTTNESACDSYTWNGSTYNSSGTYTWIGVNTNGCDIATLNLVINSTTTSNTILTLVDKLIGMDSLQQSGNYSHFTTNSNGCDSIANLNLTISSSST